MTAEIAILNKQCVVLAADSAVTTGDTKVFNTVNKLFALSKQEPVGVMVYSSAEVMGVPIETVIKEFRRKQKDACFDHLERYSQAFVEFLETDNRLFDDDSRSGALCSLALSFFDEIRRRAAGPLRIAGREGWGHPTQAEANRIFVDALCSVEAEISAAEDVGVKDIDQLRRVVEGVVGSVIDQHAKGAQERFGLSTEVTDRLRKAALDHFFKQCRFGGETGFVIAGFGRHDIFPRLRAFEFKCSALGLNKIRHISAIDISRENTAVVRPFAQRDVMVTFIEGRASFFDVAIQQYIGAFFAEKVRQLGSDGSVVEREVEMIKQLEVELKEWLPDRLSEVADDRFVQPLMRVVASMPKEELAVLAESLINLTALKRKASIEAETVGGPTDVAVISKGDGFIWIKRKHYFDPRLNPLFVTAPR